MLRDLEKNTVNFTPNFDDTLTEPSVMPALVPNLLVNGTSGIAVGMTTNIPPHNLSEVVDACIAVIDTPSLEEAKLLKIVKGPDFPTGGIIYGYDGVKEAYKAGRGRILVRAKASIGARGAPVDRRHGDPVPGEQVVPDREDRGPGPRQEA
jgi:DNA gyrase subunit A